MPAGAITSYIDVAQLTLYAFWIFFAGLIYYLLREGKREGYPLDTERSTVKVQGWPRIPDPKAYILPHGGVVMAPRREAPERALNATGIANYRGAPIEPIGNPLIDGLGPAAWANRADEIDLTWGEGLHKIVPLRVATEMSIAAEDPDPRGMEVIAADNLSVGIVTDAWVDRSDMGLRFLELSLAGTGRSVLVPINLSQFIARRRVRVRTLTAAQFADVPGIRNPDSITLLEEDKIMAYFGGGQLYATPGRLGPLL